MWSKEYNHPDKSGNTQGAKEPLDKRNSRRDFFLNIISIIFLALFLYGLFFYLPSITTSEINCDDPFEFIMQSRSGHPMIPGPCDSIGTMHPLRHWPK